jgi:hypothetical protein
LIRNVGARERNAPRRRQWHHPAWRDGGRSTVTVAPERTSADAISRPMPRPPPVTSACAERGNPDISGLPERAFDVPFRIYF